MTKAPRCPLVLSSLYTSSHRKSTTNPSEKASQKLTVLQIVLSQRPSPPPLSSRPPSLLLHCWATSRWHFINNEPWTQCPEKPEIFPCILSNCCNSFLQRVVHLQTQGDKQILTILSFTLLQDHPLLYSSYKFFLSVILIHEWKLMSLNPLLNIPSLSVRTCIREP